MQLIVNDVIVADIYPDHMHIATRWAKEAGYKISVSKNFADLEHTL
jgi:hypothetical protein